MPVKRTRTGKFAPGSSGNPSGRAKQVQNYAQEKSLELLKALYKIATKTAVEIKDENGTVVDFEVPKDSDKINAIKEILKVGGIYPAEITEQKLTVESDSTKDISTVDVAKAAMLTALNGGKKEAA